MGNPVNTATSDAANNSNDVTVTKQVSEVVKQITVDEEGNYNFPDNVELSDELKFAATAEKRRRDTQNSYTKGQQTLKELEAANNALLSIVNGNITFTEDQKVELENLKYKDPEAWRLKLNQFETEAREAQAAKLTALTSEAKSKAGGEFELSRREQVLEEFNELHNVKITDELIQNEIPPRITRKLEQGKVTFEQYLDEVLEYATTAKVIDNQTVSSQPNLNIVSGSKAPVDHKPDISLSNSYKNDIY